MGSKSSPQSLSIALNNAEQQKALFNDEPTKSLSPFFCCVVVSLSLSLGAKVFVLFVVTFRMKNDFYVSVSSFEENLSLKTLVVLIGQWFLFFGATIHSKKRGEGCSKKKRARTSTPPYNFAFYDSSKISYNFYYTC